MTYLWILKFSNSFTAKYGSVDDVRMSTRPREFDGKLWERIQELCSLINSQFVLRETEICRWTQGRLPLNISLFIKTQVKVRKNSTKHKPTRPRYTNTTIQTINRNCCLLGCFCTNHKKATVCRRSTQMYHRAERFDWGLLYQWLNHNYSRWIINSWLFLPAQNLRISNQIAFFTRVN